MLVSYASWQKPFKFGFDYRFSGCLKDFSDLDKATAKEIKYLKLKMLKIVKMNNRNSNNN